MLRQVVVPLDGSSLAECTLPHAAAVARALGIPIVLLRVVEPPVQSGVRRTIAPFRWQLRKAEASAYLRQTVTRLEAAGLQVSIQLLEGDAAERIVQFVGIENNNLLVISSHGASGLSEWNVSSVVQKVVVRAYVPTLIVRAYETVAQDLTGFRYERILVPVDGSQRAELVLSIAAALAAANAGTLLLASVVSQPDVPRRLPLTESEQALLARLQECNQEEATLYLARLVAQLPGKVDTCILFDRDVAWALHGQADKANADLVVLSAHGYTGTSRWPFGSVALNFIAFGTTPLLIVQDIPRPGVATAESVRAIEEPKSR